MSIFDFFRGSEPPKEPQKKPNSDGFLFSTHVAPSVDYHPEFSIQKQIALDDGNIGTNDLPNKLTFFENAQRLPPTVFNWFASQGFIGYQTCAIMAQNWLISKACRMPAEDAAASGWKLNGSGVDDDYDAKLQTRIKILDRKFKVHSHLVRAEYYKRIFGIRIIKFVVESDDPEFYEKPFNIDGIRPNSYRGMVQIDPYWCTPELTSGSVLTPGSLNFYEPQYWRVGNTRIHRTHLVILRGDEVPDILKPSYLFGGVPLTQQIYERVYAAERTANEGPILALTKRLNVQKCDLDLAAQNPEKFFRRIQEQTELRDNLGIKIIGLDEEYVQHDTQLMDLDSTIMTQYQLVAAIARVPATRLLGTSPKGFNSTGEHEIKTYHEFLKSIQEGGMKDLLKQHYRRLAKSELPEIHNFDVVWNPIDTPTGRELAEINNLKADFYSKLSQVGAIDGQDVRTVIVADPDSGLNGMEEELPDDLDPEQQQMEQQMAQMGGQGGPEVPNPMQQMQQALAESGETNG